MIRGVQPFGISVITKNSHTVISKFTILCWVTFIAILGCMQPAGHRLDTPFLGAGNREGQNAVASVTEPSSCPARWLHSFLPGLPYNLFCVERDTRVSLCKLRKIIAWLCSLPPKAVHGKSQNYLQWFIIELILTVATRHTWLFNLFEVK